MEKRVDYRKRMALVARKKRYTKLMVLSLFGLVGTIGATQAHAEEWTANTPESIEIAQGATSYTMKKGDTLWAIATRININVETLATANNIDLHSGQQYHLAVGTVISWADGYVKATNSNGTVIGQTPITEDCKIDKTKPVGSNVQESVVNGTVTDKDVQGKPVKPNTNTGTSNNNSSNGSANNSNSTGSSNNGGTQTPNETKPSDNNNSGSTGGNTGGNTDNGGSTGGDTGNGGSTGGNTGGETETPQDKTEYVTVDTDEDGLILESTEGYVFVSKSEKISTKDNEDGTVTTTITTINVWKKADSTETPTNENRYETVNIDEEGKILDSTDGYTLVSEKVNTKVETLENGNTITTYTTVRTWSKNSVTPPEEDKFYVGQVLYSKGGFATIAEANEHMNEIANEWFDFADANNIAVSPSWEGSAGNYTVVVKVTAVNVN